MRRILILAGLLIALAAAASAGIAIGLVLDQDPDPEGITVTEHDRLLDACMASTPEPARCPGFVSEIVDAAELSGCGYEEAAELMAWHFDQDAEPPSRPERMRAEERIFDCAPDN